MLDANMYATPAETQGKTTIDLIAQSAQISVQGKLYDVTWGNEQLAANTKKSAEDEIMKIIKDNNAISEKASEKSLPKVTNKVGVVSTSKTQYNITLEAAIQRQVNNRPMTSYSGGGWVRASESQVKQYMIPNAYNMEKYKYQFLDLSSPAGLTDKQADKYVKGKGILSGKGKYFIIAANKYNVNEIYLMSHAMLETGNGTSTLATGYRWNGVVVYNMYGIGAVDGNALRSGAEFAYNMGWTTPEKAIVEGARWISQNYINNKNHRQNTLYKMRWNPASPASHQYATDVSWAAKQAVTIEKIYGNFGKTNKRFDFPVYK